VSPDSRVAVIVFVTEEPAVTGLSPESESEKPNVDVIVNAALASALEL
jgi:hypothetical protein